MGIVWVVFACFCFACVQCYATNVSSFSSSLKMIKAPELQFSAESGKRLLAYRDARLLPAIKCVKSGAPETSCLAQVLDKKSASDFGIEWVVQLVGWAAVLPRDGPYSPELSWGVAQYIASSIDMIVAVSRASPRPPSGSPAEKMAIASERSFASLALRIRDRPPRSFDDVIRAILAIMEEIGGKKDSHAPDLFMVAALCANESSTETKSLITTLMSR